MRAVIRRVRSVIISAPRLSPEVWCAPLGPSGRAASLGAENSQIQRLDPEKSPENHRQNTHSDEVGPTKRIPSANYSLSIALQENALRVTWLLQMTSGSAAADLRLLAVTPATEAPMARHTAFHRGATLGCPALALEFSRGRRAQPRLQQDLPDAAAKARTGSLVVFSCLRLVCAPICCPMLPPKPGGGEAGLRKKAP